MRTQNALSFLVVLGLTAGCGTPVAENPDITPSQQQPDTPQTVERSTQELVKDVALGTPWAELPEETRVALQARADRRVAEFKKEWGQEALRAKFDTLNSDDVTPEALATFNHFTTWAFPELPEGFTASTDVKNPQLLKATKAAFLIMHATVRNAMRNWGYEETHDWDGVAPLNSIGIPNTETYEAAKQLAKDAIALLDQVDVTTLTPGEAVLHEQALYRLRAMSHGSWFQYGFGPNDVLTLATKIDYAVNVLTSYSTYGEDNAETVARYLEDVNAWMLAPHVDVNVGTVESFDFYFQNAYWYEGALADWGAPAPTEHERSHGFRLMLDWWHQRVMASTEAQATCTPYSSEAQQATWDAWSADMKFDNARQGSLAQYESLFAADSAGKLEYFKRFATSTLDVVFADTSLPGSLTAAELKQVKTFVATLQDGSQFATLAKSIREQLATVSTAAADRFQAAVDAVPYVGGIAEGATDLDDANKARVQAMWQDVRTYLVDRYTKQGFEVDAALPQQVVAGKTDASSTTKEGIITMGVGVRKPESQVYANMIHEAHHAITFHFLSDVAAGPAWEGAATIAEFEELEPFLKATLPDTRMVPVYGLTMTAYASRLAGRTAATLAVLTRADCSDESTIDRVHAIGTQWGVAPAGLPQTSIRAHRGTQYLQYMYGQLAVGDVLNWLRDKTGILDLSTYQLLQCQMPWPSKTQETVVALQNCLK